MLSQTPRLTVARSAAVALAAALCGSLLTVAGLGHEVWRLKSDAPPPEAGDLDRRVHAVMADMTLAEKIGQMFVTQVYGDSATTTNAADVAANQALYGNDVSNGADLVAKYHVGGIIYFTWTNNLGSPQQIASLSNGLQKASLTTEGIPLQISTDQEGGVVNRIGPPVSVSPGNMAIGAGFEPALAYSAAAATASELRAMGINMDNAPVVDVNTNPLNQADGARAFGDRSAIVSAFAAAAVSGYQKGGVAAQAKHFPGLGSTTINTDTGIAVTDETRDELLGTDIPPFRAAIAAGVKSIMTAHIIAPALDPSRRPASLSKPIITGLLRGTLKYDGVVSTDALNAGALADIPQEQVILDAIHAGNDELLMPTSLPYAVATVTNAVNAGTISRDRIDESVFRILSLKAHLGLFDAAYTTPERVSSTVGTAADQQTMNDAARRSITLLRNDDGVLPLAPNSGRHVLVTGASAVATQTATSLLAAKGLITTELWTGSPDQRTIDQAVAAANESDVTVILTRNAWGDVKQQDLVKALLATGQPVVVVAVSAPYDIAYFPSAPTYLASYGSQTVSLTALVNTLVGTNPTGRLPVTIRTPDGAQVLFPYGSGIRYSAAGPSGDQGPGSATNPLFNAGQP